MMLLYLSEAIKLSGNDTQTFFRTAYMWRFGKDLTSDTDSRLYNLKAVVPKYVEDYIHFIQGRKK